MNNYPNYPAGVTGAEPEIIGQPADDHPPEKCERCIDTHEGYCKELNEFLCHDCFALEFQSAIETAIAEHTDDTDKIDAAFENASIRTDSDGVFSSVDFDVKGESHEVSIKALWEERHDKHFESLVEYEDSSIPGQIMASVCIDRETFCGFGAGCKEAKLDIITRNREINNARGAILDRMEKSKEMTQ